MLRNRERVRQMKMVTRESRRWTYRESESERDWRERL